MLVVGVEPASPASRAGLLEGDIIVMLDDKPITDVDSLHRLLSDEAVGKEMKLTVLRRYERFDFPIRPDESPAR